MDQNVSQRDSGEVQCADTERADHVGQAHVIAIMGQLRLYKIVRAVSPSCALTKSQLYRRQSESLVMIIQRLDQAETYLELI